MAKSKENQIASDLTEKEQCRTKLAVYYGSADNYMHPFKEVVMNAVDEISNNFKKGKIMVSVDKTRTIIKVGDTGRGIPLMSTAFSKRENKEVPNYVLLFESLFAGTNYDNIQNGKITTGTNGCGTCVLNFTSKFFNVTSCTIEDGKSYVNQVKYIDGDLESSERKEVAPTKNHGTIFEFKLDPEIYTNTVFGEEEIRDVIQKHAGVSTNIEFILSFENEDGSTKQEIFKYDNTMDYCKTVFGRQTSDIIPLEIKTVTNEVKKKEIEDKLEEKNTIEIMLSLSTEPVQQTFLNRNYLPEKGTIYDGIIQGLVKSFSNDIKGLKKEDVEMSFNIFASILSTDAQFQGQTKFATKKELYKKITSDYIKEQIVILKQERPEFITKVISHLKEINTLNGKTIENISKIKNKLNRNVDNIGSRPAKLIDCLVHDETSELFICEGDSACTPIKDSRDSKHQAVFPIRGKVLSCLKADYNQILHNDVILDIYNILNCGMDIKDKRIAKQIKAFDIKDLRYGRIVLAADADPDGATIRCLLLTMFYRLSPELIKQGKIYIAKPPLYEIALKNDKYVYATTDQEKEELEKQYQGKIRKIDRCKGLGECDADVMEKLVTNPETRVIERITVEDAVKMSDIFEKWFGKEVEERREYIVENLHKYVMNDLD